MLDIQFIRDNAKLVQEKSEQKGIKVDVDELIRVDGERRKLIGEVEELRSRRNELSGDKKPSEEQISKGRELKDKIADIEQRLEKAEAEFNVLIRAVPNMPLDDVPVGKSEAENKVVKTAGEKPKFDFEPKNHAEIGEVNGWIDKGRAAKVVGSRFAYIKGDLARLHFALMNWAIDVVTDEKILKKIANEAKLKVSTKPFILVLPPAMIRTEIYDAMDRLEPREDRYKIEGEDLWLQGSAEHVLGSMHADEIIDEKDLPVRYVGYATSFRREAGSYGKDRK